jgi:hypothetical protein
MKRHKVSAAGMVKNCYGCTVPFQTLTVPSAGPGCARLDDLLERLDSAMWAGLTLTQMRAEQVWDPRVFGHQA